MGDRESWSVRVAQPMEIMEELEKWRARAERIKALAYAPWAKHDSDCIRLGAEYCLLCRLRAVLAEQESNNGI